MPSERPIIDPPYFPPYDEKKLYRLKIRTYTRSRELQKGTQAKRP